MFRMEPRPRAGVSLVGATAAHPAARGEEQTADLNLRLQEGRGVECFQFVSNPASTTVVLRYIRRRDRGLIRGIDADGFPRVIFGGF